MTLWACSLLPIPPKALVERTGFHPVWDTILRSCMKNYFFECLSSMYYGAAKPECSITELREIEGKEEKERKDFSGIPTREK
jgi:hypothetical protein